MEAWCGSGVVAWGRVGDGEEWTLLPQCAESLVKQAAAAGICCLSDVGRVWVPPFACGALEAHGQLAFPLAPRTGLAGHG